MGRKSKIKKILVDSCVWIALYDTNDRQHSKAVRVFKNIEKKHLETVVHALVVIETLSILKYKKILGSDLKQIRINLVNDRIENCINQITLESDDNNWKLLEANNKMGLVDILLLNYCRKNNLELITFDKHLNDCWMNINE